MSDYCNRTDENKKAAARLVAAKERLVMRSTQLPVPELGNRHREDCAKVCNDHHKRGNSEKDLAVLTNEHYNITKENNNTSILFRQAQFYEINLAMSVSLPEISSPVFKVFILNFPFLTSSSPIQIIRGIPRLSAFLI